MSQPTESTAESAGSAPATKKPSKGLIAGGVAAAVLAAAGGAYALGAFNGLLGGGKQPADVLPASAVAYARLDLNPSAAQKVGAFRLLDKLPDVKNALNAADPKRSLFDWMQNQQGSQLKGIDYANDVGPWLGDRIGVATLPASGNGQPVTVMAVEVKDQAKAEEGLKKVETVLRSAVKETPGGLQPRLPGAPSAASTANKETVRIYQDGYALIVEKDAESRLREELQAGRLAGNDNFSGDMAALGDQGIASAWYDQKSFIHGLSSASVPAALDELAQKAGRVAMTVRFASDYAELAVAGRGSSQPAVNTTSGVGDLPADTGAVLSLAGGKTLLEDYWPSITSIMKAAGQDPQDLLKKARETSGLNLPGDAGTLLGTQFDVIAAKQDFRQLASGGGLPKIAARMTTDTAAASQVLDNIQKAVAQQTGGLAIPRKVAGDKLLVAANTAYMDQLASPQGKLSDNQGFTRTVPDPDKQASIAYVDLDAFESQYLGQVPQERREFVQALQSIGVVSTPVTNGESKGSIRISIND